MKKWANPGIEALDLQETAHNWTGVYRDGGYIGDGIISGHLSWDKPTEKPEETKAPDLNVLSGEQEGVFSFEVEILTKVYTGGLHIVYDMRTFFALKKRIVYTNEVARVTIEKV